MKTKKNKKIKILITPRSFGKFSKKAFYILKKNNIFFIKNKSKCLLNKKKLISLIKDVDGIIAGIETFSSDVLKYAKKLVIISKYGVGVDNIDLNFCKKKNITVTTSLNTNTNAVADHAFTLLCSVARKICIINNNCKNNNWKKKIAIDIFKKKLGIIGVGNIGKCLIKRAFGFNMKIFVYDRSIDYNFLKKNNNIIIKKKLSEIFKICDFISLHLPLNKKTKNIINKKLISYMKPNSIIINTARGGLIDEKALFLALKNNKIYGAGLDVFKNECSAKTIFKNLSNVILTPHCAASTIDSVNNMSIVSTKNLIKFLKKKGKIKKWIK